jgi:hypothetical protein
MQINDRASPPRLDAQTPHPYLMGYITQIASNLMSLIGAQSRNLELYNIVVVYKTYK